MGVEVFHVVWGLQTQSAGAVNTNLRANSTVGTAVVGGQRTEFTKAQIEEVDPRITEKVILFEPVYEGNIMTVEAETAQMAARAVEALVSGRGGTTGVFTESKELNKGTAGKDTPTIKTTAWKEETSN